MRYTRLLSWTLFVVFFLIYLTAIKLVRGDNLQQQQRFIKQVSPLQAAHPFFGQTFQTSEPAFLKQARDLSDYVTFEQQISHPAPIQQAQLLQSAPTMATQLHGQPITRRQHSPQQSQAPTVHSIHPFASQTSSVASSGN